MLQLYTWLVKYLDSIYLDKVYLGNICLTEPAGACLWFPWFNYFFKLLERLQYLILFGTSSQIFGPRYLTDCKLQWAVFMFSLLNWLQDDLKLFEGFCSSKCLSLSLELSIFNFVDFCHKELQIFLVRVTELSRSRISEKLKLFW